MIRNRLLLAFLVALLAGGGLAYGTYRYLGNVPVKEVTLPTQPVVVATVDLSLGAELRASDLRVIDWPEGAVPDGAFNDPASLVGRGLLQSVVRNEPVLPNKLAPAEAGAGLPPVIPRGKRAVSVRVNEVIGVAGYVLPGSYVDVVATVSPNSRPEDATSKIVLSGVQVLAAGTRLEQDLERDQPIQVTVVTLLVSPEQSERLTLASTEGKIQLALRNPLDTGQPDTPGIKPQVLLASSEPTPRPAPRPVPRPQPIESEPEPTPAPKPPTVEVIRGTAIEHTVVGS